MRTVVFYGRPGCHLCDDAMLVVKNVRGRVQFELQEVDIESDDLLFMRYLERIPVVTIDGSETFELFVDERELELALIETGRSTGSQ